MNMMLRANKAISADAAILLVMLLWFIIIFGEVGGSVGWGGVWGLFR